MENKDQQNISDEWNKSSNIAVRKGLMLQVIGKFNPHLYWRTCMLLPNGMFQCFEAIKPHMLKAEIDLSGHSISVVESKAAKSLDKLKLPPPLGKKTILEGERCYFTIKNPNAKKKVEIIYCVSSLFIKEWLESFETVMKNPQKTDSTPKVETKPTRSRSTVVTVGSPVISRSVSNHGVGSQKEEPSFQADDEDKSFSSISEELLKSPFLSPFEDSPPVAAVTSGLSSSTQGNDNVSSSQNEESKAKDIKPKKKTKTPKRGENKKKPPKNKELTRSRLKASEKPDGQDEKFNERIKEEDEKNDESESNHRDEKIDKIINFDEFKDSPFTITPPSIIDSDYSPNNFINTKFDVFDTELFEFDERKLELGTPFVVTKRHKQFSNDKKSYYDSIDIEDLINESIFIPIVIDEFPKSDKKKKSNKKSSTKKKKPSNKIISQSSKSSLNLPIIKDEDKPQKIKSIPEIKANLKED